MSVLSAACGDTKDASNAADSTGSGVESGGATTGSQGAGGASSSGGSSSSQGAGGAQGTTTGSDGPASTSGGTSSPTTTGGSGGTAGNQGSGAAGGTAGDAGAGGVGAQSGTGGDAGTGGSAASNPFDYPIDPDALTGCRSPEEQGCLTCCRGTTQSGDCSYLSGDVDWSEYDTDPYYVRAYTEEGPCPEHCSPCAECKLRDEEALRDLEERADCDCETIELLGDDCFTPGSCGCYCSQVLSAMDTCPPAE